MMKKMRGYSMFHDLPCFASNPPLRSASNIQKGDNGNSKSHNRGFVITYYVEGPICTNEYETTFG